MRPPENTRSPRPRFDSETPPVAAARALSFVALVAALALTACATLDAEPTAVEQEATVEPLELSEKGKEYLELVFRFKCAPEYQVLGDDGGPALSVGSDADWAARKEQLETCVETKIVGPYTSLETVKAMTWNGDGYAMSDEEMQAIVELGPDYLRSHVERTLADERARAGSGSSLAGN